MTECTHCGKPLKPVTDNLLCDTCRETYWQLIRQLGDVQLPALTSIMLKHAHIGTTGHMPNRGNTPMPIDTHAQKLIGESEAWLAEQAGKIRPQYANYKWRKAWLAILSNRHTILNMPTTPEDYTALEHISRRNEQALTPEEDLIILGTCPTCHRQLTGAPDMPPLPQGISHAGNQSRTRPKTLAIADHRHAKRCRQGTQTLRLGGVAQPHQPMAHTRQIARHADRTQRTVRLQPRRARVHA